MFFIKFNSRVNIFHIFFFQSRSFQLFLDINKNFVLPKAEIKIRKLKTRKKIPSKLATPKTLMSKIIVHLLN